MPVLVDAWSPGDAWGVNSTWCSQQIWCTTCSWPRLTRACCRLLPDGEAMLYALSEQAANTEMGTLTADCGGGDDVVLLNDQEEPTEVSRCCSPAAAPTHHRNVLLRQSSFVAGWHQPVCSMPPAWITGNPMF